MDTSADQLAEAATESATGATLTSPNITDQLGETDALGDSDCNTDSDSALDSDLDTDNADYHSGSESDFTC